MYPLENISLGLDSITGGTLTHARARRSTTGSFLPTARVTNPETIPARSQTLMVKGWRERGEGGRVGGGRLRWADTSSVARGLQDGYGRTFICLFPRLHAFA